MNLVVLRRKLDRLGTQVPRQEEDKGPTCDAEWLAVYEKLHREEIFRREPDIEWALSEYRRIIDAKPKDMEAESSKDLTPEQWRWKLEVEECFAWLAFMLRRALMDRDGYRESEFLELRQWYQEHRKLFSNSPGIRSDDNHSIDSLSNVMSGSARESTYAAGAVRFLREQKRVWEAEQAKSTERMP